MTGIELQINDRIRNRKLAFFNSFNLKLKFDAVGSTFSFGQYFNPENTEHKEMSCIGHYHTAFVNFNGEKLLTGSVLSIAFKDGPKSELSSIGGYSLPGVLEDCNIATDDYPLQNDGMSLQQIAAQLLKPFGLQFVIDNSVADKMQEPYGVATADEGDTVAGYLSKLAAQKNIILSHNANGNLVFTRAKANLKPVYHFENQDRQTFNIGGRSVTTGMDLQFNGQAMHSQITVIKEKDTEDHDPGEETVKNPYVINTVYRPKVIKMSAGTNLDCKQAAINARAAELKQGLRLVITTDTWLINGKVIKPNTVISVKNPKVYLYKSSNWFVEEVNLIGDEKKTVATLTCVLPDCYNNQENIEYLFAGINLH